MACGEYAVNCKNCNNNYGSIPTSGQNSTYESFQGSDISSLINGPTLEAGSVDDVTKMYSSSEEKGKSNSYISFGYDLKLGTEDKDKSNLTATVNGETPQEVAMNKEVTFSLGNKADTDLVNKIQSTDMQKKMNEFMEQERAKTNWR